MAHCIYQMLLIFDISPFLCLDYVPKKFELWWPFSGRHQLTLFADFVYSGSGGVWGIPQSASPHSQQNMCKGVFSTMWIRNICYPKILSYISYLSVNSRTKISVSNITITKTITLSNPDHEGAEQYGLKQRKFPTNSK